MAKAHRSFGLLVAVLWSLGGCATGSSGMPDYGSESTHGDDGGGGTDADEGGAEDAGEDAGEVDDEGDSAADAEADGDTPCTTAVECDDGIDCTFDSCDNLRHVCVHTPEDAACDDGSPCTTGEHCDPALGCDPGTTIDCGDGIACTRDECLSLTGECTSTPDDTLCAATERCRPALGGCVVPPPCGSDAECDDGNRCNGVETCGGDLGCEDGTPVDCRDAVDCTDDVCEPASGACSHPPDDARCDDGNACNGAETCDAVAGCRSGTPLDCSDGVDCTEDSCSALTGACSHAANDSRCDDRVYCNGPERCDPVSGCSGGTAPSCSDGIACTSDSCDGTTDSCTHTPNNALCSDGRFCNGVELCSGGVGCGPGTPAVCSDGLACTTDRCDPAAAGGAGACVGESPDRDGDTYGDAACTGTDCNDGAAGVHPGAAELCNGGDDDCDGATDEGYVCPAGTSRSCTVGGCTGSQACSASCTWGSCVVSGTEVCNGLDDDCDGLSDEVFACRFGAVQACSVGSCPGTQSCVAGCTWGACTASASEACNGLDDNCNGVTDEGYSCIMGRAQSCTIGACSGSQTCQPGCYWGACTAGSPESCNGLDDDCNGATDEIFPCRLGTTIGCTNACGVAGSQSCASPSCTWGSCCAAAEVCGNGCDDNCAGGVDEGCVSRRILFLLDLCPGSSGYGIDHVTPALTNLGYYGSTTFVYNDASLSAQLSSGTWDLVIVDEYYYDLTPTTMDQLNAHVLAGRALIFSYWDLFLYSGHALLSTAGVALSLSYSSPPPIYRWITSPLFTTPNAVPDISGYTDTCNTDGQYLIVSSATAHAGYAPFPFPSQAALTVNSSSRMILNGFMPQIVSQNADGDGKPDMVELYENEIDFLL
ncbi:MAG: putative metal-binding motif-containing protein [Deltaproteobacteria bacterium]|nr:putative metal-binding motif-containing protein [Deltaproteobacteria bacterium]